MVDFSRLKIPIKAYDNCTIIDVSSGAFPRYIEVRMPGKDGARRTAVWDGSLNLANNDKVMCHEYPGNPILRIVSFGGDQAAGTDGIKVSKVWEPDGSATTLAADNSGDNTISGHIILSGVAKAIKGSSSNVPDLGTSTAAERFGNLYLADTKTIDNPGTLNIDATTAQVFKIATTEKMRLVSGGLGIGTATIPHGTVGAAILALDGPNASTSGPHIQTTTASDDYPLFQLLSLGHDDVYTVFDAYYDGAWKSSDAGSNFMWSKFSDAVHFYRSAGNAQGAGVSWIQAFTIDLLTGKVGLGTDVIPHGGIGAAILALDGPNASTSGPHIQTTTASDDYPLFQLLSLGHDDVYTVYDAYYDGAWKSSDAGSNFMWSKFSDAVRFYRSSGNAQGAGVSWTQAFIIDLASGKTGINNSTLGAQLAIDQSSTTAAIPVLYLDQADLSEEMIEFNATIGIGNAIEAAGAKTLTTTHFIKVTIPGGLTRYFPVGTIA